MEFNLTQDLSKTRDCKISPLQVPGKTQEIREIKWKKLEIVISAIIQPKLVSFSR